MTPPTLAEFRILFTDAALAAQSDTYVQAWMNQAILKYPAECFLGQWAMAIYLLTAHFITEQPEDGTGTGAEVRGPITSESVIDTSRSYGGAIELSKVPADLQWLTTTRYGIRLIGIIRSRPCAHGRVILTGASRPGVPTWRR